MEKKQQQLLIGGVAAAVVLGVGGYFAYSSLGGGGEAPAPTLSTTASGPGSTTPVDAEAATPAANPDDTPGAPIRPTTPGAAGGIFSNSPGTAPGAPGTPGQQVAQARNFTPPKDPFKIDWKVPPDPPSIFMDVQPMRLASPSAQPPPPPNTTVREVPTRRVSGILSGDGVYAILEGEGDPEIVKPGMLTRDEYRVARITSDGVLLRKKVDNVTYEQQVPLSDAAVAPTPGGGFGQGGPGFSGGPGGAGSMGPGGPRRGGGLPGRPGGKGGEGDL